MPEGVVGAELASRAVEDAEHWVKRSSALPQLEPHDAPSNGARQVEARTC